VVGASVALRHEPEAAADLMRMYADIDVRPALPAITAPTLVLHRSGDRLAPSGHARALADSIPNARHVELDGNDHLAFTGDAEAILDEVEEFITGERRDREPQRVLATVLFRTSSPRRNAPRRRGTATGAGSSSDTTSSCAAS
jgi:hypothetical protein